MQQNKDWGTEKEPFCPNKEHFLATIFLEKSFETSNNQMQSLVLGNDS